MYVHVHVLAQWAAAVAPMQRSGAMSALPKVGMLGSLDK
jgi:hypothetical protein